VQAVTLYHNNISKQKQII